MTRSIRRRLTAALRRDHRSGYAQTTAVITLPHRVSSTVPRWSPGPGYIEALTATVWAQPLHAGRTEAVVVLPDLDDGPVMITGAVAVEDVLGFGGLCDKPHRIRWQAEQTPVSTPLATDHPAAVYQDCYRRLAEHLDELLHRLGRPRRLMPEQPRLSATPRGGVQVAVPIWIEPGPWWRYDIRAHAAVLAGVLRHYGRGTRLRFLPSHAADVIDPLYQHARRLLTTRSVGEAEPACGR
ncbi:hypothetical protein WEI85_00620 [Actinomycetes bacterium KLBMP 9797]